MNVQEVHIGYLMYESYTLAIIRFPLVNTSDPKYNFTMFHPPGRQEQLKTENYFKISSVNGIHTEEVDLLEFESNKMCLSTKDVTSIVGCSSGFTLAKGVRGRCPFPSAR